MFLLIQVHGVQTRTFTAVFFSSLLLLRRRNLHQAFEIYDKLMAVIRNIILCLIWRI